MKLHYRKAWIVRSESVYDDDLERSHPIYGPLSPSLTFSHHQKSENPSFLYTHSSSCHENCVLLRFRMCNLNSIIFIIFFYYYY